MTNEIINQFNDSGKASYETFQQFNAINVETLQKLTNLQFSLFGFGVEKSVEQAKLLSSGSDIQEIIAAESALASSFGTKLMEIGRETTDILTDSRQQYVSFAQNKFEAARTANEAEVKQPKKAATKKTA